MIKIKADVYAQELKRNMGQVHALRIAKTCMEDTSNINNIPKILLKDKKAEKKLANLHGFWKDVFHILNKLKHN